MPKFINAITFKQAPDMALLPAEQAWVGEMMAKGLMLHFFIAADMSKGWTVWSADSAEQVLQEAERAPMAKFMQANVMELTKD
jgi:muconolactone delta-isomerase